MILVNVAKRMFQLTFADEEIPMEINCNNNVRTCRPFPFCLCVVNLRFVADTTYVVINEKRRYENKKKILCLSFFCSFAFQETDPFDQVNLVIPGSLLPFKKEIFYIFEKEKENLIQKK